MKIKSKFRWLFWHFGNGFHQFRHQWLKSAYQEVGINATSRHNELITHWEWIYRGRHIRVQVEQQNYQFWYQWYNNFFVEIWISVGHLAISAVNWCLACGYLQHRFSIAWIIKPFSAQQNWSSIAEFHFWTGVIGFTMDYGPYTEKMSIFGQMV